MMERTAAACTRREWRVETPPQQSAKKENRMDPASYLARRDQTVSCHLQVGVCCSRTVAIPVQLKRASPLE